jgi:signal transduction histidine kinase
LQRLLLITGVLACLLIGTILWITQLHRQVEERTKQLKVQIHERQRVEQRHAMEQERARVAQDLHDELGASLTEIGMLATRAKSASVLDAKQNGYFDQVAEKSHSIVTALDEIVWAMNPKHDSLASLVSYFCLYAERFLGLANIAWRLEDSSGVSERWLDSQSRHQLFLVFKEALNNVVRHSGATEVLIKIQIESDKVWLSVNDNGRGIVMQNQTDEMNGLTNMRTRIEKIGGQFEIVSGAGQGTTLRFCASLIL